jgi:transposase
MSLFLAHTAAAFKDDYCIMFMDGAGWHRAKDLSIPDNIKVEFLPPYSPELNPVEHVWEHVRENHFGNDTFPTLDAVEQRLCSGLRHCMENPEIMKSITCFSWLNTLSMPSN